MDPKDSPPEAAENAAGGNGDDQIEAGLKDDPSQQDAPKSSAEAKPSDAPKDAKPEPSVADTKSKDGDKPDEGKEGESTTETPAKFDDDLDTWAEGRGYKLTTDTERKLAQDARNNQREFRTNQESEKAEAAIADAIKPPADLTTPGVSGVDEDDPLVKEMASLKSDLAQERDTRIRSEYFVSQEKAGTPVTTEDAEAMKTYLDKQVANDDKVAFDYLTNPKNLAAWRSLAKAEAGDSTDTSDIEEQAAQKERERIAREGQADGPTRSASSAPSTKQTDDIMAGLTAED